MNKTNELKSVILKLQYTSPSVVKISVDRDILTASHNDPNMGEWDTERN